MKDHLKVIAVGLLCMNISQGIVHAQIDDVRLYAFGHSLIDHRPPAIPTPSDETTILHWMYQIAQDAGHTFAAGGQ